MPEIDDEEREMWVKVLQAGSEQEVEQIINEWAETCIALGMPEIEAERKAWMENFELATDIE